MQAARPRGNLPKEPLKWTIERASNEFKLASGTLRKNLHQISAEPDSGGCYSTEQLCQAIFDDMHSERLRTQRQLTRKYELENQITEASVLSKSELAKVFGQLADAISTHIMSATELPREVRDDVLRELASWPLSLEEVSSRATKFPRGKGQVAEEDENED